LIDALAQFFCFFYFVTVAYYETKANFIDGYARLEHGCLLFLPTPNRLRL